LKYRKYFRKTSLKQKGHGETFLKEVLNKKPKSFLEIGVFHGVTARNVCELLYQIHGNDFKYVGLDLFEKSDQNKFEVIPSTNFKNPFKKFYHQYIMRQDPYSIEAVSNLLKKFKNQVHLIKGNSNQVLKKMDMSKIDFIFFLNVNKKIIIERIEKRKIIEKRSDDELNTILKRYDTYMETTRPVLDFYSKNPNFHEIDGTQEIDEITRKIDTFINV